LEEKEMQKLAWKKRKMEEGGEMGVGTLLIFIAMILVAAVAAGVLVQTAYKLQQQAEATGDEALQDVATGFKVSAVWGTTDGAPSIDHIYLKIALTAGSPGINLDDTKIEIVQTIGGSTTSEITLDANAAYDGSADDTTFGMEEIRDMAPTTDAGMMTAGDLFEIHIDLNGTTGIDMALDPQEQLSILLIPKHGVPTYLEVTSPATLEASSVVVLK
jgi:flagellin FlaB